MTQLSKRKNNEEDGAWLAQSKPALLP